MKLFSCGLLVNRINNFDINTVVPNTYWSVQNGGLPPIRELVTQPTTHVIKPTINLDLSATKNTTEVSEVLLVDEYLSNLLNYNSELGSAEHSSLDKTSLLDYNL